MEGWGVRTKATAKSKHRAGGRGGQGRGGAVKKTKGLKARRRSRKAHRNI